MRSADRSMGGFLLLLPSALSVGLFLALALPGLSSSFTYDESVTVAYFVRSSSFLDAVTSQIVFNNHPAYTAQAWVIDQLGGSNEIWMRLPAVLAGAGAVALVASWTTRRWGALAGVAAGTLTAVNPLFVELSRQARGYALAALAVTMATVILPEVDRSSSRRFAVGYAVAVAVGLLAHLYVAFAVAGHGAWVAREHDGGSRARWLRAALRGSAVAAVGYAPMLQTMVAAGRSREGEFEPTFPREVAEALFGSAAVAAVVAALVIASMLHARSWLPSVLVVLTLLAAVWLVLRPFDLYPRFLVWAAPLVALLVADGVRRRPMPFAPLTFVLVIALAAVAEDRADDVASIREVASIASSLERSGAEVCFLGYFRESFAAYLSPRSYGPGCDVTFVRRDDPARQSIPAVGLSHVAEDAGICVLMTERPSTSLTGLSLGCSAG